MRKWGENTHIEADQLRFKVRKVMCPSQCRLVPTSTHVPSGREEHVYSLFWLISFCEAEEYSRQYSPNGYIIPRFLFLHMFYWGMLPSTKVWQAAANDFLVLDEICPLPSEASWRHAEAIAKYRRGQMHFEVFQTAQGDIADRYEFQSVRLVCS